MCGAAEADLVGGDAAFLLVLGDAEPEADECHDADDCADDLS